MSEIPDILIIALSIAGVLFLFLIFREVNLWYFRINDIVKEQEKTRHVLTKLLNFQATGQIYGVLDDDWIVENIKTGEIIGLSQDEWDLLASKDDYALVKDNTEKYKIVKYTGRREGQYGVHEVEDESHQGSGIFTGTLKECKDFIQAQTEKPR